MVNTAQGTESTRAGLTLDALAVGETAEVVALAAACTGFSRQRLLDLGLTPGARVRVAMDNAFADPRAYEVRGTTIALRRELAAHISVRRLIPGAAAAPPSQGNGTGAP